MGETVKKNRVPLVLSVVAVVAVLASLFLPKLVNYWNERDATEQQRRQNEWLSR